MKAIAEPKMGFVLSNAGEDVQKIFKDPIARVLWCTIRCGHITSQYFNPLIIEIAEDLRKSEPKDYRDFLKRIVPLTNQFGRICVQESRLLFHDYEIDHEFWADVYNMCFHNRYFKVNWNAKTEGETK